MWQKYTELCYCNPPPHMSIPDTSVYSTHMQQCTRSNNSILRLREETMKLDHDHIMISAIRINTLGKVFTLLFIHPEKSLYVHAL